MEGVSESVSRRAPTIKITPDTYPHAIPAMQEDGAAKVAALIE